MSDPKPALSELTDRALLELTYKLVNVAVRAALEAAKSAETNTQLIMDLQTQVKELTEWEWNDDDGEEEEYPNGDTPPGGGR